MAFDHQPATPPAYVHYQAEAKSGSTCPLSAPESSRPGQPNIYREKSPAPVQQLRSDTQTRAMTISERKTKNKQKPTSARTGWTKKDPSGKMPSDKAGTRAPYVKNHLQRKEKVQTRGKLVRPNFGKIKPEVKPVQLASIPKSKLTPDELVASVREVLALVSVMTTRTSMDEYNAAHEEVEIAKYPTEAELAAKIATELAQLEVRYDSEIKTGNRKQEAEKDKKAVEDRLWAEGTSDRKAAPQLAEIFREFGRHIVELTTPKGKKSPDGLKNGGSNGLAHHEALYADEIATGNWNGEGAQA